MAACNSSIVIDVGFNCDDTLALLVRSNHQATQIANKLNMRG